MIFEIIVQNWNWDAELYGEDLNEYRRIVKGQSIEQVKLLVDREIERNLDSGDFGHWRREGAWLVRQRHLGEYPRIVKYAIKEGCWDQTEIPGLVELTSR